jgi:hypothetical protein
MSKTKQDIIAQVSKNSKAIRSINYKIEDINALWHWCRCLEEANNKLKEKVQQLHEEINKVNT